MNAFVPLAAFVATLAISQVSLTGCGGGQGTSSSATTEGSTAARFRTGTTSATGGSVTFAKPHPTADAQTQAERRAAGSAAPFVEPGADNSVPTFGAEASAAERSRAEADLLAYLRARSAHLWAKACALLAASVREGFAKLATSLGHAGCARMLPVLAPPKPGELADPLRGTLLAFRVHGQNAFALFYGPGRQRFMVPMNREGGTWRPTQAAPIAYPPVAP